MHCRVLPSEALPHQPKLLVHYLNQFEKVSGFYQHAPSLESILSVAKGLDFPKNRRTEVAEILADQNAAFGSGEVTRKNVERLANGAVAIVSGQQAGLFTGPAYAIYKALSAVRIAKDLTAAGIEAVPVFWIATEDHDLDEVRHTTFFHDGSLVRYELTSESNQGASVGKIKLGDKVSEIVRAATLMLEGFDGGTIGTHLRESYTPEESYGSAFAKFLAKLLPDQGLILLDPLDHRLHRVAAPLYAKAMAERDALNDALLERGKKLESAGYSAQVKVTSKSTVLFFTGGGVRKPITATEKGFRSGEMVWTREELVSRIGREPEKFSPNALFRPVVQDYLLPTVAYIGGPAEISYFAQSEVVYRQLLERMPVMLPRAGFTLVDTKAQRLLKQYGLKVEDVWGGPQTLAKKLALANVPKGLNKSLEKDAAKINSMLDKWSKSLLKVDSTLKPPLETAKKKIAFQVEKLRGKTGRAADRKTGILQQHTEFLLNLLYPDKTLQSRALNALPLLARWGLSSLKDLEEHCSIKNIGKHFIVPIP